MSDHPGSAKKTKIGHLMLVPVHMRGNPDCACMRCVAKRAEADDWARFFAEHPNTIRVDSDTEEESEDPKLSPAVVPVRANAFPGWGSGGRGPPPPPPTPMPGTTFGPTDHGSATFGSPNRALRAASFVTPPRAKAVSSAPVAGMLVPVSLVGAGAIEEVNLMCRDLSTTLRGNRFVQARSHAIAPVSFVPAAATSSFAQQSIEELEALGLDTDGVVMHADQIFSPAVVACFLEPMRHIGVSNLSIAADFCPVREDAEEQRMIDFNHKGCFFFVPLMMRNKTVSLLNNNNEPEFAIDNGVKIVNRKFWSGNLDIKRLHKGKGFFKTLEIGAHIPDWTIADVFKHKHRDAMEWMARNGAVLPNNSTLFLSMKQEYATVFLRNMESEMVAKARLAGYQPLFLMKNAIIQKTDRFGVNGTQVTTINVQPKSYLALVGFFKGKGEDLKIITLKNGQDNFMVIDNHTNV